MLKERVLFFGWVFGFLGFLIGGAIYLRHDAHLNVEAPVFLSKVGIPADLQIAETLESGKLYFLTSCAKCHGNLGEGSLTAPSLIDAEWRHGSGRFEDIYPVVRDGVAGTQMNGWSGKMQDRDIRVLAAYVRVLGYFNHK